ncbi:g7064 [Coccomyxa elongata]
MANRGRRFVQSGGAGKRKVIVSAVPTRALNSRKVVVSTTDLTLDARFTIASELRQHAASRQSQGREKALAQKRGLPPSEKLTKQQEPGESQKSGKKSRSRKARSVLGGVRIRPTAPAAPKNKRKRNKRGGKKSSEKMHE